MRVCLLFHDSLVEAASVEVLDNGISPCFSSCCKSKRVDLRAVHCPVMYIVMHIVM